MALPFVTPIAPGPVGDSIAKLTKQGMEYLARSTYQDLAFKVTHFAVGTTGFRPDDPRQPADIDVSATELGNEIYRGLIEAYDEPLYNFNVESGYVTVDSGSQGMTDASSAIFDAVSAVFTSDPSNNSVGRVLAIINGPNAGYYTITSLVEPRVISGVTRASKVSVTKTTGKPVSFAKAMWQAWKLLKPDTTLRVHRSSSSIGFKADMMAIPSRSGVAGMLMHDWMFTTEEDLVHVDKDDLGRLFRIKEGYFSGVYKIIEIVNQVTVKLGPLAGGQLKTPLPGVNLEWEILPTFISTDGLDSKPQTDENCAKFELSDLNRRLRIQGGPNAGVYQIYYVNSLREVTVASVEGGFPILRKDEEPVAWEVIESAHIMSALGLSQPTKTGLSFACRISPGSRISNVIGELGLFATVLKSSDTYRVTGMHTDGDMYETLTFVASDDLPSDCGGWTFLFNSGPMTGMYLISNFNRDGDKVYLGLMDSEGNALQFGDYTAVYDGYIIRRGTGGTTNSMGDFFCPSAHISETDIGKFIRLKLSNGTEGRYIISSYDAEYDQARLVRPDGTPVSFTDDGSVEWQIPDLLPGDMFLFGLVHMPIQCITFNQMHLHRPTLVL